MQRLYKVNSIIKTNKKIHLTNSLCSIKENQTINYIIIIYIASKVLLVPKNYKLLHIRADDKIQYAEVKFFKSIRSKLNISDQVILKAYPGIDNFLENDISIQESTLSTIVDKYFEIAKLPKIDLINIDEKPISENKDDFHNN